MERVFVARVDCFVSVCFAGADEFDGRLFREHSADLNGRSLAAEKFSVFKPESVL